MRRSVPIRHSLLAVATALCLCSLASPVLAQSATGGVAGRAVAGDQIVLTNDATGASRSVTVGSDGSYRVLQLPVGNYHLQVQRGGQSVGAPVAVNVALGGTTTVNLGEQGNVANLDTVQVIGSRIVNRVDVRSTESATNVNREELARIPVEQSLGAVALVAPGVIGGNSGFGGISFGGSSVAENSVFINGLNVTDFYRRQSFSTAPFAFFQEFQVKTGGYSVEFGRSTGGVINAVSRRGSNELQGGVQVTFEPQAFRAPGDDHQFEDIVYRFGIAGEPDPDRLREVLPRGIASYRYSRNRESFTKTNVWASGPLIRDRLFAFVMFESRDSDFLGVGSNSYYRRRGSNGFWGGKVDWQITDDHLLELLAFSDEADSKSRNFAYSWIPPSLGVKQRRTSTRAVARAAR